MGAGERPSRAWKPAHVWRAQRRAERPVGAKAHGLLTVKIRCRTHGGCRERLDKEKAIWKHDILNNTVQP